MKKSKKTLSESLDAIKDPEMRKEIEQRLQDVALEREKRRNEIMSLRDIEKADIARIREDSVMMLVHRGKLPRKFGVMPVWIPMDEKVQKYMNGISRMTKFDGDYQSGVNIVVSKVTVVGLVFADCPEDDTYRLVIAATACSPKDEYRKRSAIHEALLRIDAFERAFKDKDEYRTYNIGNTPFTIIEMSGCRKDTMMSIFSDIAKDIVLKYERMTFVHSKNCRYISGAVLKYMDAEDGTLFVGKE